MNQDVFLITAIDMYNESEKKADEAYRAYHGLIDQTTKYAESVWSIYLMHTHVSLAITESIQQYKNTQQEVQ